MDIHHLSENDLKTLWVKDPFMYHSMEVEYAKTISSQASSIATRKSRVSMEYHLSLLATEFLQDEDFESLGSDLVNHLTDIVESTLSSLQNNRAFSQI